ncbi:MAG: hypothetical protein M1817_006425 [Caeruleum heppii]|nr:MAG: hypothetical protein M1817_006425 [Caeruleum heppii]
MAFRLLSPLRSPLTLGLTLSSVYFASTLSYSNPSRLLCCDARTSASSTANDWSYSRDAKVPVVKGGRPNPRAYRQISSGSITGLIAGLAVGTFSKTLTLLLGLLVFGVQFAASKGINIIPYNRLQRYARGINLRSVFEDNVAFKLSFASTFALAAFVPL